MKIIKGANLPPLIFGLALLIAGLFLLRLPPSIPAYTLDNPLTDLPLYQVQTLVEYIQSATISMPLIVVGLTSIALGLAIRKPTEKAGRVDL